MHGFKEEMAGKVDVVHLNLASAVGREVGGRYGIKMVPTSLLFDNDGRLVRRIDGLPRKEELVQAVR